MPGQSAHGKNERQYEALKDKGMSKERAAEIANSPDASHDGGKKSGLVGNAHQGGTTAQHETAGTQRWQSHGPEVEMTISTPLSQLRSETFESIADLEIELATLMASGGGTDDEHDPDGSTLAYERSRASSLLAQARRSLEEIDTATERLRTGNYGLCDKCGARIAAERLAALPATAQCVTCANL